MVLCEVEGHINSLRKNSMIRPTPDDGLSFHVVLFEGQAQMTASKDLLVSDATTS